MPEFILNKSGRVQIADAPFQGATLAFDNLDSFTQGYIEAMFFTDEEQLCEESGRDMPSVAFDAETMETRFVGGNSPGFGDLAPATLARIIADCTAFRASLPVDGHGRTWLDLASDYAPQGYDDEQAGRDFWFTRNGHGVGFWDRGLGEVGDKLSNACGWRTSFQQVDSYVGDDGLIYLA